METQVLTTSVGGTEYTVVTHMRFFGGAWHLRYIKLSGVSTLATGELSKPGGYNSAIDPSLEANAYGGGVAAGRIYNAGALINGIGVPSAIGVWFSDDSGSTWSGPTILATETTPPGC